MASYRVQIKDGKTRHEFTCSADQTILDAADGHGIQSLRWGCRSGVCGTCVSRLLDGQIEQHSQMALDDDAIESGLIVLCIATPLSDVTIDTEVQPLAPNGVPDGVGEDDSCLKD